MQLTYTVQGTLAQSRRCSAPSPTSLEWSRGRILSTVCRHRSDYDAWCCLEWSLISTRRRVSILSDWLTRFDIENYKKIKRKKIMHLTYTVRSSLSDASSLLYMGLVIMSSSLGCESNRQKDILGNTIWYMILEKKSQLSAIVKRAVDGKFLAKKMLELKKRNVWQRELLKVVTVWEFRLSVDL